MNAPPNVPATEPALPALTNAGRVLMLVTAFLGWFCAGFLLSITSVALQPATVDLLSRTGQLDRARYAELSQRAKIKPDSDSSGQAPLDLEEEDELKRGNVIVGQWVSWLKCAFLFGAAFGGLLFGAIGDRFGRTKGMGLAILTYSVMAGVASLASRPEELLVCWFAACTGVGGMWPNGVALVAEAWSSLSRTASAGIIGAAANIGIYLMSSLMTLHPPAPSGSGQTIEQVFQNFFVFEKPAPTADWQWVMLIAAAPAVLGLFSLIAVPESPLWLASRGKTVGKTGAARTSEIFRSPYLPITLIGIALATVPIFGGWGSADWMVQWADRVGGSNPALKAQVNQSRAVTGVIGSLLGGWIASVCGRKTTYFFTSLAALCVAQYTFWMVVPTDKYFLWWVSALGLISGIYFGWLPFCLPELFPTRARSAGAGVSFNFGRILTGIAVLATGALMEFFKGDYAQIGRATSLVFAFGLILIWFAPDTSKKQIAE
jgi:SHS family sialic acid transporter-like MFS transporter